MISESRFGTHVCMNIHYSTHMAEKNRCETSRKGHIFGDAVDGYVTYTQRDIPKFRSFSGV
jgi:hypothetical protein